MGPIKFWHIYHQGLYAVIDVGSNQPIGIVEASGARGSVRPGWWLDKRVRGRGYGYKLVDTLALYLKSEGYTGVGPIDIQTHDEASRIASGKLADRFARHFGHK
jgi:RimJ/RimL family protein N-acetyltransferase